MQLSPPRALRPSIIALCAMACCQGAMAQSSTLPTVVVTGDLNAYATSRTSSATRTDTPVEQIPQSVVSVSKTLMEDQEVKTLSDALRNVSNVNEIDPRDTNNVTFKIRGFNAGVVVDGVAMPGYFSNLESLVNVEQIDVLKGPAGNVFGSGQATGAYATLGGTIAISTSSPERTPIRQAGITAGSYGARGVHFDFNQPLSQDMAVRLVGEASRSRSESDNVFFRKQSLFPSMAWTPNASRSVVIKARSISNTTLDYSGLPQSGTLDTSTLTLPRSTNFTARGLPDTITRLNGINVQWMEKLDDQWTAHVTLARNTAFVNQKGVYVSADLGFPGFECFGFGVAGATYNACGAQMWDKFKTTTFSPSLTGKFEALGARHVVHAGVDVETTRDHAYMAYPNGFGYLGPVSLSNPVMPVWVDPATPADANQQKNTYKSRVAYLQDQMHLGNWHFTAGLRYSRIDVVDIYSDGVMFSNNNVSTNSKWTPRVGVVYEWTPAISTFAGYSAGMKVPQGSNFATSPKPEESRQKEVGLRFKNLGGLTATLAWFDLERTHVAITDPMTFKAYQSGKQRSTGMDVDVQWRVDHAWTLLASLTSQTAKMVEDNLNPGLVGKQLFNVPQKSARLAARYTASGQWAGWGAGLGMTYRDRLPGNSSNTFFTPAATVWDAQISYKTGQVRYGIAVNNVLDKKYFIPAAYFAGGNVTPAAPRTFAVSADFGF
jgi:iron complex outermembrane receptor protein